MRVSPTQDLQHFIVLPVSRVLATVGGMVRVLLPVVVFAGVISSNVQKPGLQQSGCRQQIALNALKATEGRRA